MSQILNEEGLPIIDITEPVLAPSVTASVPILPEEPVVLPLWTLPSIELERRRAERNRVLDLLEEEERIEVEKDEEAEEDEKQKTAQKRREAAKQDIAGLKAARELQRKMGRALVRDVTKQEEKKVELKDSPPPVRKELKSRKSVSFALPDNDVMPPAREGQSEDGVDWGDVVPARLRPLKSAAPTPPASYGPMKTTVVERFPNTAATDCTSQNKDSDDESAPGSLSISEDETPTTLQAYDHHDDEESSEEDEEGDLQLEDEEYDFDKAQHQREIALEYYEKRNRIGAQAAAALTSHSHDADEDPWDQPVCYFKFLFLRQCLEFASGSSTRCQYHGQATKAGAFTLQSRSSRSFCFNFPGRFHSSRFAVAHNPTCYQARESRRGKPRWK